MNSTKPETWKPVHLSTFPYEVSDHGRVRRLSIASENVRKIHPRRNYEPKIITPVCNNGYQYVTLCAKGHRNKRVSVHSIVLETFVGPRPKGMYGCHNNGNRADNHIGNIRWDTPKSNQQDRIIHGHDQNGENNGSHKLSNAQVKDLRAHRKESGDSYKKIGKLFGISTSHAHFICTGRVRING